MWILLLVLLAAVVLLALESVSVDIVALGLLIAAMLSGLLTPAEALAGFGNEAVVVLAGLFVLAAALDTSGAMDLVALRVGRLAGERRTLALPLLLLAVVAMSGFINNTACTALFLPLGFAVARSASLAPSRVLMPLAFASILGGSITIIGTSTNVIVRGLMPGYGLEPLGLFELAPVAVPVALVGVVYLVVTARLLPERSSRETEMRRAVRAYLSEFEVAERSSLGGRTLAASGLGRQHDVTLIAIRRDDGTIVPRPDETIEVGDVLVVEGSLETLQGPTLSRLGLRASGAAPDDVLAADGMELVEVVLPPGSDLVGRTLAELDFRERFAAGVIAFSRHGGVVVQRLGEIRLRLGDLLLVQGEPGVGRRLDAEGGLVVLGDTRRTRPGRRAPAIALAVLVGVVATAVWGGIGLAGAVLTGCLVLLVTRCLTPQQAYAAVDWRLLVLVAGLIAFGTAMEKTGVVGLLAGQIVGLFGALGERGILAGVYLVALLLTQPLSNQATALVVLPVAIEAAAAAGLDPRAMAATVALAASSSFLTPLEPSCLLVYGPGGYRFGDFPRLGIGLTVLSFALTIALVPWVWPS